jgi:glycosyltransferase involved in cell wall biosynthesis
MDRLRVLHVTPYSAQAWAYGGIPRLMDAMVSGLAAAGHEVTVCTTDAGDDASRLRRTGQAGQAGQTARAWRAWDAETRADGVVVRVFPNVSNRLAYHAQFFTPIGLHTFLRRHRHRFDVAHLHACRNLPGVMAGSQLRAAGIAYVVAPNGTAPIIERRHTAKRIFDAVAGRRLLSGAAAVLAVTEAERRQLLALGVPADRIHIIPNPIDTRPFLTFSANRRSNTVAAPASTSPTVAYLGKLTPRKRVDVLIRALGRLRSTSPRFAGARLVIAGNDMGAGSALRAVVDECGLHDAVAFAGLLRNEERLRFLAEADVLAYASEDEIFGLVPLEALLCGTPVIVAGDSGCGEVIRQVGGGLIVPPGDEAALADALSTVLERGPADMEVSYAAARVRARFSHDVVTSQLENLYSHIAPPLVGRGFRLRQGYGGQVSPGGTSPGGTTPVAYTSPATPARMLALIPAHNEAANLPRVIDDIRAHYPGLAILVVDDGSTDGTTDVLESLDVRWLAWDERRGIGAAIRAGLRYASRHRFDIVVRVDADGQHGADDIAAVTRPIVDARAEVVLGSRYHAVPRPRRGGAVAMLQRTLDRCLSTITGRRITDATSGFCALGPQAIRMLAEHHPTGYPEPELRLFLSRNALRVLEVPVQARTRLSGRTSLTPIRVAAAAARVLLAMLIVPLRPLVPPPGD